MGSRHLILIVLALCSLMEITHTCTISKFEDAAKACVIGFARSLRETKNKTCSNHYGLMKNCIQQAFNECKSSTDRETTLDEKKRIVIASEQYYCSYGGINPFNGKIVQGCPKKAQKKMRKCSSKFHKHFKGDSGSTSLCRKYDKVKKCIIRVAENLCKKTIQVKNLMEIFKNPFNPYCSDIRSSFSSRFGSCTRREYLNRSRDCLANFIRTLKKYPKKPCGLVFRKRLHNCAKNVALHCHKNDTSYNKKRIETGFKKMRSFNQRRYCDGFQFQFPYPAVKSGQCTDSYFEHRKKCSYQFVEAYIKKKTEKSLCGQYAEAKRCAKNVTLEHCNVTPKLEDDIDFIYDEFNPFCAKRKDPLPKPQWRRVKKPRRSLPPDVERKISTSGGKSISSKVSTLVAIPCFLVLTIIS
ncbi:uncharacterized protein LOC111324635 isoform X3 [Stylophora pistillata]|uniref:uncharacterized protein LOC111324635 isoform X3 n=1 Tax=Stylophora pistillata TaxID=50429 RepID=UPI000C03C3B1|nr:uncharacterized protein LOC111324635 isoform X3 [Stylophora pistillata]